MSVAFTLKNITILDVLSTKVWKEACTLLAFEPVLIENAKPLSCSPGRDSQEHYKVTLNVILLILETKKEAVRESRHICS